MILLIVISLLVGFILGAVTGIKFTSKDLPRAESGAPSPGSPPPKVVSSEDINTYENILKADPNNLKALISLGNLYFDSHQPQKAVDVYARALKIDRKNADVRTDMAIMYREMKDFDKAVKELRQAAADNPQHVNSRFNLGIILLHDKQDFKGAIKAWEDFLKVEPTGERAESIRQRLGQLRELSK